MEKYLAIINKETVKEIEDTDLSFRELVGNNPCEIRVLSEKGKPKTANLEDRIGDYFEPRRIDLGGIQRRYNCLEIEMKQKINFREYCQNTSCIIVDRNIYELSRDREKSSGHITLLGERLYLREKSRNVEIEIGKEDFDMIMFGNYINHKGTFYPIKEGRGEIELNGRNYAITNYPPQDALSTGEGNIKKYEIRYRESREVIIRKIY